MDILKVLTKLGQLEQDTSKLYEWLSNLFVLDAEVARFFRKLSEDEQAHFDLVKYQERIVRKSPKDFEGVDVDLGAVDKTLSRIAEFRATSPSVRDAIRFALDLETEIVEKYASTIMNQSNKELAALMKNLTNNLKEDHYQQLIQFAKSYDRG
jgi:rubrerythrin